MLMSHVERGGNRLRASGEVQKVRMVMESDMKGLRFGLRGGKNAEAIRAFYARLDPSGKKCAESGIRIILLAVMEASLAVAEDRI